MASRAWPVGCYPVHRQMDFKDAARELDVVEIVVDGAEVPRGTRATVIHDFGDGTFMLEVVGAAGEAEAMPVVGRGDVRVVWRLPAGEQNTAGVMRRGD